jgi:putative toxin-antitoxin system antitoxin component (TIGR02293 family)
VFGSKTKARAWLQAPSRALRGEVPLSLLDTDIGTQSVEDELVRIEHGVHA